MGLTHDYVLISLFDQLEQMQMRIDGPKPNFLVWRGEETSRCAAITAQGAIKLGNIKTKITRVSSKNTRKIVLNRTANFGIFAEENSR